jgi:hypothetical protein
MLYEGIDISPAQRSKPKSIPAPVGGLNGRDAKAAMAENEAYQLDNMLPGTTSCKVRPGVAVHSAPLGFGGVYSLDVYSGGLTADQIFALTGDGHYVNVSSGTTPVTVKTGLHGQETISVMFSTTADNAQFLIVTTENDDTPFSYNGTAVTDLVFTGLNEAAALLNYVWSYMGRLFWGTQGKLGFYYLPPGQIQGAMEWFDLGQIATRGGYLRSIATFSIDAGDGPADYIIFITSKGEYLMYQGLDPGDATAWTLAGKYKSAPPVGRKCLEDYGGDLVVLTQQGAIQFSEIRKTVDTRFELTALTSKLGNILLNHNIYSNVYGWCMKLFAKSGWLIVSVPATSNIASTYNHFIMNTTTQAWGNMYSSEINALCWCVANDMLYYGRYDGSVRQAAVGTDDNGSPINWVAKTAYNYYGGMGYKQFHWATFLMASETAISLTANLSVDFKESAPLPSSGTLDPGADGVWDYASWDVDIWGAGAYTQHLIQSFNQYGVAGSIWVQGQLKGSTLEWFATQHLYEEAEGLLG